MKEKWYNDKNLLLILVICLWPVGLYGIYKSEKINKKWKKAIIPSILAFLLFLIII